MESDDGWSAEEGEDVDLDCLRRRDLRVVAVEMHIDMHEFDSTCVITVGVTIRGL